jgi:hypothetical protein
MHGDDPPHLNCRAVYATRRRTISLVAIALTRASSSSVAKRRLTVGARSYCHDSVPGTSEMLPKRCIQIFKSLRPFGFVGCDD